MEKHCTKCDRTLTLESFSKHKRSKDGHQQHCKDCNKKYREENSEYRLKKLREYHHSNRDTLLEKKKKYYTANKTEILKKNKGIYVANRKEIIQKNTEYARNNREVNNKAKRKYSKTKNGQILRNIKNHKRRYAKVELPFNYSIREWRECKTHFCNTCAYCGKESKLTKDHFIAVSNEGEFTRNNIIPVCMKCNSSKSNKDFFEWYHQQSFYQRKREQKILKYLSYQDNTQQLSLSI